MSKFNQLTNKIISKNPKINRNSADALAAFIGRKKYGPKHFARLATAGRKRKQKGVINNQTLILLVLLILLAVLLPVWPYSLHFTVIPSLAILVIVIILLLNPRQL